MSTIQLEDTTTFQCVVDGHNGIYTYQAFVEMFEHELRHNGVKEETIIGILSGPENPDYSDDCCYLLPISFVGRTYFDGESGDIFSLSDEEYGKVEFN